MYNFTDVPDELKALPQWVVWKDKIPHDPKTKGKAKAGDPSTWSSYAEALSLYKMGQYDGIGFEFIDGIVGIDLDHCVDPESGEIHPEALHIVELMDSYTEFSPSGTGLHIYVYGGILSGRKDSKRQKGFGIEMYDKARYFTVTGRAYKRQGIQDRAEEVRILYNELFQDKPIDISLQEKDTGFGASGSIDYLAIGLEKDDVLASLWNGHRSTSDESSNDMALMSKLAYWLNQNPLAMIQAFRESPYSLQKDWKHIRKMDRQDYLNRTAMKAIAGCSSTAEEDDQRYRNSHSKPNVKKPLHWEKPVPFDSSKTIPFNPEWLPSPLSEYASSVAESIQVPIDMVCLSLLAVLSICNSKKYSIEVKPDYTEPLNLYCIIVADPSERKSAVLREVIRPIEQYEALENDRLKPEIDRSLSEKKYLETVLKQLESRVAKDATLKNEYLAKLKELENFELIRPKRYIADDTTTESLSGLMCENDGRMAILSGEGGLFEVLAGLYTGGRANFDLLLKAYSGENHRVDRKGRASEYLENPALSILMAIQPSVLNKIMNNPEFSGKGLISRILFTIPDCFCSKDLTLDSSETMSRSR